MKADLVEMICGELRASLERLAKAAMAAHEAATDPGSKAESKYDTRSLEESYLATGQARQVRELAETLRAFETLKLRDFKKGEEIEAGALVTVSRQDNGESVRFLLAPASGGLEVDFEGENITLLSPESPLYGKFLGKRQADIIESPPFEIVSV